MTLRPCLTCGTPANGAYCPEHDTDDERRAAKARTNGLTSSYWIRLRELALERDQRLCQLRIDARCTIAATSVHIAESLNGDHLAATLDDCTSACAHCHGGVDGPRAAASRSAT